MQAGCERLEVGPRPTLWRTCRVLANARRLRILRELLGVPEQSVSQIAKALGCGLPTATVQLRCLAARGLLRAKRRGSWVYYRVEPDPAVPDAERLVGALREAFHAQRDAARDVFRLATAFTHPRRQVIYELLGARELRLSELRLATGFSRPALQRHLHKLRSRAFVVYASGRYRAVTPPGPMGRLLADLAPSSAR